MLDLWVWAILLLILGMGLAVLEVFIPSGGILGFLSICSILGAIVVGFRQGPIAGVAVLTLAVFGLPLVVVLALKYWPETPMGRRIILMAPKSEEVLPDSTSQRKLRELVGQVGVAKSQMLPSGAVVIDGRIIDAVSEGVPIEPGQRVCVIEARGNRVVVRPVEDAPPATTAANPLDRPIDSVISDPWEGPSLDNTAQEG